MRHNISIFLQPLLFAVSALFAASAYATTVMQVGMDELAQQSEFVFEGEVLSKAVRPSSTDGRPCTYFQFEIVDVIKGDYSAPTIERCFSGGTLNGLTMQVSEMTMPTVGETGIYFVDALGQEPIHPLLGWHQGHYLVTTDGAQTKRVVPAHPEQNASASRAGSRSLKLESPPDVETFKQMIRDRL